ncbi:MAG TPA: hypothetical protein GX404_07160 [Syntrophomonadaceae bacterium]|jgi:hypothetical protein|nr:hypothetical protein [Syntrophomonadaceae bacterium]
MNFNQVSLKNNILQLQSAGQEGLLLNKGELLRGQVHSVAEDGLLTLFIKGRLIEASTEVFVRPGQQLLLLVDEVIDGKVYLKMAPPEARVDFERDKITANLRNLGIRADDDTIKMAQKLLANNLPVTRENLSTLRQYLTFMGAKNEQNLNAAAFAMARGIKSPQGIQALSSFLGTQPQMPGLLQQLQTWLEILSSIRSGADSSPQSKSTIPNPSTSASLQPQDAGEQKAASSPVTGMANMAKSPAGRASVAQPAAVYLSSEEGLEETIATERKDAAMNQGTLRPEVTVREAGRNMRIALSWLQSLPGPVLEKSIIPLLDGIIRSLALGEEELSGSLPQKLQLQNARETQVIRAIQLLQDILEQERLPQRIPELKDLALRLEHLQREVGGQRIMNAVMHSPIESNPQYYYLALPIRLEDQYHLAELCIHHEGRKNLKDMDQIRFVVSLDTISLGIVLFDVSWKRSGEITLQGLVETQAACDFMNKNMSLLLERLQGLGYRVHNLGMRLPQDAAEMQVKPVISPAQPATHPIGIDVRI